MFTLLKGLLSFFVKNPLLSANTTFFLQDNASACYFNFFLMCTILCFKNAIWPPNIYLSWKCVLRTLGTGFLDRGCCSTLFCITFHYPGPFWLCIHGNQGKIYLKYFLLLVSLDPESVYILVSFQFLLFNFRPRQLPLFLYKSNLSPLFKEGWKW